MKLNQEKYDKLIAIASAMCFTILNRDIEDVVVETHHGKNAGKIECMSTDEIEEFLDTMFEYEISYMGIEEE